MEKQINMVACSDAHWLVPLLQIPKCDLFIYAGDWSGNGSMSDFIKFCVWLRSVDARYKIIVPGNHDVFVQKNISLSKSMIKDAGGTLLVDESFCAWGLNIYGTPWTPRFGDWGFMRPDSDLQPIFKQIPRGTDILVSHSPPEGVLDLCGTKHVGSKALLKNTQVKGIKMHIFGHIHEGSGKTKKGNKYFYNVSACDENYNLVHLPNVKQLTIIYNENGNVEKIKVKDL